jgi:hypothetical protein
MPLKHGSKLYCQLLLDPHRYKLAEKLAAKLSKERSEREGRDVKVKVTALLRDMVYEALEKVLPASEYKAAEAADEALWRESVKKRVEGRMRSRQEQPKAEPDA